MAMTLEQRIVGDLIEFGDGDEFRREQIVESFAENATNDFMEEVGLKSDASFAIIYPAVLKAVKQEIDWDEVDAELTESREDALAWFNNLMEAVLN